MEINKNSNKNDLEDNYNDYFICLDDDSYDNLTELFDNLVDSIMSTTGDLEEDSVFYLENDSDDLLESFDILEKSLEYIIDDFKEDYPEQPDRVRTKLCPYCHTVINHKAKKCVNCGKKLKSDILNFLQKYDNLYEINKNQRKINLNKYYNNDKVDHNNDSVVDLEENSEDKFTESESITNDLGVHSVVDMNEDFKDNYEGDSEKMNLKKLSRDLINKIERIPQFEEKVGIKYENISIILEEDFSEDPSNAIMKIAGDIFEEDNEKINKNRTIITTVTIYDNENYILYTGTHEFYVSDFLGFDNFMIYAGSISVNEISKIRIFPK